MESFPEFAIRTMRIARGAIAGEKCYSVAGIPFKDMLSDVLIGAVIDSIKEY